MLNSVLPEQVDALNAEVAPALERLGVPVLGVMPWLDELFPPEDSLDLLERRGRKRGAELEIAVLRLPSLSNFSDLDPLEAEPTVQLRWVAPGEELGQPDAVVVPGSKQTLRDLAALLRVRIARAGDVRHRLRRGDRRPGTGDAPCRRRPLAPLDCTATSTAQLRRTPPPLWVNL